MFVVDTNVLVYAADTRAPEHTRCRGLLEEWRRGHAAWYLTWGICYEFLSVVTHARVLRRPWSGAEAWRFLEAVQSSPGASMLRPTERHADVLAEVLEMLPSVSGNLWHDAHVAVLMREHGIRRVCTRDVDFHRFPFVEPIDPLTADP